MAILINTSGVFKETYPYNGNKFSLSELQNFVGGYIEIVRLASNLIFIVNEEGLLEQLDVNIKATNIATAFRGIETLIVGNAVLCSIKEIE